jgi:hypothetical protein
LKQHLLIIGVKLPHGKAAAAGEATKRVRRFGFAG